MLQRIASIALSFALTSHVLGVQAQAMQSVGTQQALPAGQEPTARGYQSVTPAVAPIKAVVSIAPLRGLIEPLLPPGSTVDLLIPPGVSEHGYEIPPAKLAALARADLVVLVGMGLEGKAEDFVKASQKPGDGRAVIVWEQLLNDRKVNLVPNPKSDDKASKKTDADHNHKHNHADGESCSACAAAGYRGDPHVWLDPIEAGYLVIEAADRIESMRPAPSNGVRHPVQFLADEVLIDLAGLHRDLMDWLNPSEPIATDAPRRPIVVGHDAFGWMAKRYNLLFIAVSGLNATEPKPADLRRAMQTVKEHDLKIIFTEPQISPRAMQRIAETTGAKVQILDPLGSGDYFEMMYANGRNMAQALGKVPLPEGSRVHRRDLPSLDLWNRVMTVSGTKVLSVPASAKP